MIKFEYPFFGYAPGNYQNTCVVCKEDCFKLDKLSFVCPQCSMKFANMRIVELEEKVNQLTVDNATHEYNEAERLRYQPEYERQLLEEKEEAIRELVEGLEHARDTTGSEEYYEYFDDLITKHKPQP